MASGAETGTKRAIAASMIWFEPVTALGTAVTLVLVEPASVLPAVATVPVEVLEPVT